MALPGACQSGGSVIDWVMKAEGVSFRHAVEVLRGDLCSLSAGKSARPFMRPLAPVPLFAIGTEDRKVLHQVVDYYHATLKESPEALGYLERRGLNSSEMIERFNLGFSNRTLGYRLPTKRNKSGQEIRSRMQRLGILRESGHEHFNGSIVIPILDEAQDVAGIYGRKIRDDLRDGTPFHLYLPGPHRGVWNVEALKASREIILCESLIDGLTFWCADLRNVTSSYGVSGFTEDILSAFKKYGTKKVLIAYDRDDPGKRAAEALAQKLMAEGIGCSRIHFPKDMDANEYALKCTPAKKGLEVLVRSALWLCNGKAAAKTPEFRDPAPVSSLAADFAADQAAVAPSETIDAPVKAGEESSQVAPEPPGLSIPAEINGDEVVIRLGDRRWRIRGLSKNTGFEQLKINVLCGRAEGFFVDTLDLYSARQRAAFVRETAVETGQKEEAVKKDLGKVFLKLEELRDEAIRCALEPQKKEVTLSPEEREEAMEFLKDPNLLSRILCDFERCGVVGEKTNKLAGYLAAVSRKLDQPLAVIVRSSSAAGKTMLMESILSFIPIEDRVKYSAMSGQSLFYMGEKDLKHKVLAIVEEEGAERASYPLKLLQSEGELTMASTGKDPATGRLTTHEYRVEGPIMAFVTTTAIDLDEEFLNRCIVLTVSEDREQTKAIHRLQREKRTEAGRMAKRDREKILRVQRNAQRLLDRVEVINPYALKLTFLDDRTRTRRDHEKYLTLIDSIALLHQHQRPKKTLDGSPCIEVTLSDIDVANRLSNEVLGRSLDEMPPQTRRFLGLLFCMVRRECERQAMDQADYRFTRRQACEETGWGLTQVRAHLERLIELEYVLVHRGGRGQSFVYELLYNGEGADGRPFIMGLLDVEKLESDGYDPKVAEFLDGVAEIEGDPAVPYRGQNGGESGSNRDEHLPDLH